jgi:predicted RNA-binding protein YlqC (UPF0109 family)
MASPMAAAVEVAARALVDQPAAVQGRTAEALRTLVAATAQHHGVKATLEIRDPDVR